MRLQVNAIARVMFIGYLNDQNKLWFMPFVDFQIFNVSVSVNLEDLKKNLFLGIMMGGLNAMAPSRSKDIQKIINRALIGGILSCMLRASIAGILYKPTNEFYYGTHNESFGCIIDGNKTEDYNPFGCDLRCIEKYKNQAQR